MERTARGIALACAMAAAVFASIVHAGVVEKAGIPNTTDGKLLSCSSPKGTLGIVRGEGGTTVFHSSPRGVEWSHRLPAMKSRYDHFWIAPDGERAVISISVNEGDESSNYFVSGTKKIEIKGGLVAVDFQGSYVLVVTTIAGSEDGYRARIYDSHPWRLIGDSTFSSAFGEDFRRFAVRLSEDGRSYYYIDRDKKPYVRDASSGQQIPFRYQLPRGGLDDLLLKTEKEGVAVAGNSLWLLGERQSRKITLPQNTAVDALVETGSDHLLAVRFAYGWGTFNLDSGQWHVVTNEPVAAIHGTGKALTVVSGPPGNRKIGAYDLSGNTPLLLGAMAVQGDAERIACANRFGYMTYSGDSFQWESIPRRNAPVD